MNLLTDRNAEVTMLWQKNNWVFADFASAPFIGPSTVDGVGNTTENRGTSPILLPQFDFWKFDYLMLHMYAGSFTGGTTPKLQMSLWGYDSGPANPGFFPTHNASLAVSAGQGGVIYAVELLSGVISNTGVGGVNAYPITVTYKPLWGQLEAQLTGGPSDCSGIRTALYGVKK